MILKDIIVTSIEGEPWTSPDGKVTIWKVKIEMPDGERNLYSTMSKTIATEGWRGDVELYTNAKGKDYIRQAPKEEQSYSKEDKPSEEYWADKQAQIRAQWAIGQAMSKFEFPPPDAILKDPAAKTVFYDNVEWMASRLYAMVDRVKATESEAEEEIVDDNEFDIRNVL